MSLGSPGERSGEEARVSLTAHNVQPLTPSNRALHDAAQAILKSSLPAMRSCAKTLLTFSSSAVLLLIALFRFTAPLSPLGARRCVVLSAGAALAGYVLAMLAFGWAYLAVTGTISLNAPETIKDFISARLRSGRRWLAVGMCVFCLGSAFALVMIAVALLGSY